MVGERISDFFVQLPKTKLHSFWNDHYRYIYFLSISIITVPFHSFNIRSICYLPVRGNQTRVDIMYELTNMTRAITAFASPISVITNGTATKLATTSIIHRRYQNVLVNRRVKVGVITKMQEQVNGDDVDDTPSDTYVPASEGITGVSENQQSLTRTSLTTKLVQLCAVTSRGDCATEGQRAQIEDISSQLEELNPTNQPVDTDLIDGYWNLLYSPAPLTRNKQVIKLLLQPVLQIGQVRQRLSVIDGILETEVDVVAFPASTGVIKSIGRITPVGGERLEVTIEKTNVTGGKLIGQFDLGGLTFDLPIESILKRFGSNTNITSESYFDTYYLDDKLRISRDKDGKLYIYTRLD